MRLDAGLVFLSDSRTNAGVDHVNTFRKMTVIERPGDRVLVLMTAGNLLCGFLALTRIVEADLNLPGFEAVIREALFFILLACIFDLLDGRVALFVLSSCLVSMPRMPLPPPPAAAFSMTGRPTRRTVAAISAPVIGRSYFA